MLGPVCFCFHAASAVAVIGIALLLIRKARIQFTPGNLITAFQHHRRLNAQMLLLCYAAAFFEGLRFVAEAYGPDIHL